MKCFMKEPRLRGSAEELLAHPWIAQIPKNKVEQSSQLVAESVTSSNDRDAMLNTIKLYEKDQHTEPFSSPEVMEDAEDEENWDDEFGIDSAPAPISLSNGAVRRESQEIPVVHTLAELQSEPSQSAFHLSKEDAKAIFNDEVWDDSDEDEEGMLLLRLQQQQPPLSNESFGSRSVFVKAPPPSATSSWDRSTLVPMEKRMTKLQYFSEQDDDDGFGDIDEEQLLQAVQQTQLSADKDDDFNDLDDSKFHQRSSYFGFDGTDMARENIFDDELDFEYSSVRDPHQKATTRVVELLALLDPSMDDNVILDACNQLVSFNLLSVLSVMSLVGFLNGTVIAARYFRVQFASSTGFDVTTRNRSQYHGSLGGQTNGRLVCGLESGQPGTISSLSRSFVRVAY